MFLSWHEASLSSMNPTLFLLNGCSVLFWSPFIHHTLVFLSPSMILSFSPAPFLRILRPPFYPGPLAVPNSWFRPRPEESCVQVLAFTQQHSQISISGRFSRHGQEYEKCQTSPLKYFDTKINWNNSSPMSQKDFLSKWPQTKREVLPSVHKMPLKWGEAKFSIFSFIGICANKSYEKPGIFR